MALYLKFTSNFISRLSYGILISIDLCLRLGCLELICGWKSLWIPFWRNEIVFRILCGLKVYIFLRRYLFLTTFSNSVLPIQSASGIDPVYNRFNWISRHWCSLFQPSISTHLKLYWGHQKCVWFILTKLLGIAKEFYSCVVLIIPFNIATSLNQSEK